MAQHVPARERQDTRVPHHPPRGHRPGAPGPGDRRDSRQHQRDLRPEVRRSRSGPRSWLARLSSSERSCSTWPGTLSAGDRRDVAGDRAVVALDGCPGQQCLVPRERLRPEADRGHRHVGRHGPRPRMAIVARRRRSGRRAVVAPCDRRSRLPEGPSPEPGLVRSAERRDRRSADVGRGDVGRVPGPECGDHPAAGQPAPRPVGSVPRQARSEVGHPRRDSTLRGANTTLPTRR